MTGCGDDSVLPMRAVLLAWERKVSRKAPDLGRFRHQGSNRVQPHAMRELHPLRR
jgi:hypothetical protein